MTPHSRLIRCLFLGAVLAALLAGAVGVPGAAGARCVLKLGRTQRPAAPRCLGKPATIVGQGTLHGTAHADVIVAGAGADHIVGGGGDDRICAGAGDDKIEGGIGSEGSPNDDVLSGDGAANVILGRGGDDEIHGAGGTNS